MTTATQTTVLLVDDDAHFRETLADAMSLKDIRVECAGSADAAKLALSGSLPSVILLDVQLPDVSGIELCRQIKRDPRTKGVPVVLLSAKYTEPADRAEGLLTGADAYLSKPINIEALQEEIRYLVDN